MLVITIILSILLLISIITFLRIDIGLSGKNQKITELENTLDEIKKKTDKLGTYNF